MEIPRRITNFFHSSNYHEAARIVKPDSVTVLYGLSGSGKTQICARLALEYKKDQENRVIFIKAKVAETLNKDICEVASKFHLNLDFDKKELLADFLVALSKLANEESKTVVMLDDVEDENILEEILEHLEGAGMIGVLKNISVIVTSQVNPRPGYLENQGYHVIHIEGFSKAEAGEYLKIPEDRLEEVLDSISCLPVALNPFKQAYHSFRLENDKDYIDRYLRQMEERSADNKALSSIKICLDRAAAENSLLKSILKYLPTFCGENITVELLVALVEEVEHKLGVDEADSIVDVLVKRSIANIHISDTQRKYLTLHDLVKDAVDDLMKDIKNKQENLRLSLQAFSRIMPCDGRHHQSDVIPKLFKHALSLRKSYKKITKSHAVDGITKLLFAQLHTSIGYCMMSQRYDVMESITMLEEGKRLFLEYLFQGTDISDDFEKGVEDALRRRFVPDDDQYMKYMKSLQSKYRLSHRDFKTLFPEANDKDLYMYKKSDHLSDKALEELEARGDRSLLPVEELAVIYPMELFAQHLHLLAKANGYLGKDGKIESLKIFQKADVIYNSIQEHCGVTLLGLYINKRLLLNLQTEMSSAEKLDALCKSWEDLRGRGSGKVYESGIVRSVEMSEDEYHQLICLEGELLVYGVIATQKTDTEGKKNQLDKGEVLIKQIELLCLNHHRPNITLSRAYIEISKFYQLCTEFQKAISYSVKSMMENKTYWLDKQRYKQSNQHPELDDDKINKFITIYRQLESCVNSLQENKDAVNRQLRLLKDEKNYLEDVLKAWQEKRKSREEGGDKTFQAIKQVLDIINQEVLVCQAE